ncbi:hypothetical protein SDJN03_02850, partial [Cucurbita argyrosperma subsp. sororia]
MFLIIDVLGKQRTKEVMRDYDDPGRVPGTLSPIGPKDGVPVKVKNAVHLHHISIAFPVAVNLPQQHTHELKCYHLRKLAGAIHNAASPPPPQTAASLQAKAPSHHSNTPELQPANLSFSATYFSFSHDSGLGHLPLSARTKMSIQCRREIPPACARRKSRLKRNRFEVTSAEGEKIERRVRRIRRLFEFSFAIRRLRIDIVKENRDGVPKQCTKQMDETRNLRGCVRLWKWRRQHLTQIREAGAEIEAGAKIVRIKTQIDPFLWLDSLEVWKFTGRKLIDWSVFRYSVDLTFNCLIVKSFMDFLNSSPSIK